MNKFKVGDTITIRNDLTSRGNYKLLMSSVMLQYKGRKAKIVEITWNNFYLLCLDRRWAWSDDMFEVTV